MIRGDGGGGVGVQNEVNVKGGSFGDQILRVGFLGGDIHRESKVLMKMKEMPKRDLGRPYCIGGIYWRCRGGGRRGRGDIGAGNEVQLSLFICDVVKRSFFFMLEVGSGTCLHSIFFHFLLGESPA